MAPGSYGNLSQAAGPGPQYPQACSVVIGSKARSPPPLARRIFNTNRTAPLHQLGRRAPAGQDPLLIHFFLDGGSAESGDN